MYGTKLPVVLQLGGQFPNVIASLTQKSNVATFYLKHPLLKSILTEKIANVC